MTVKSYIESVIALGEYNAEEQTEKINLLWIDGKLTDQEKRDLIASANNNAKDEVQVDLYSKIVELENRIFALEHKGESEKEYPVWVAGYTTKKGEIVQYDYDNDGTMDLLLYNGGREQTALRPGRIDGWYVVDSAGNILGTFYNGEFTPAN